MKRLIASLALVAALAAASSFHVWYLTNQTQALSQQLRQAQELVEQGNWTQGYRLTQQAWQQWQRHTIYLHTTLHHEDIDQVGTAFQETLAILQLEEQPGEYVAANARILHHLELLAESETPSLKNIF